MIDNSIIDKIRDVADVVDVVGDYVDLRRSGGNFQGLCPFHNEKTPSFVVSPAKGIYKCFGCGAGGDPIAFVEEMEKVPFIDAIKLLARKYNIEVVEEEESEEAIAFRKARESRQIVFDKAVELYKDRLLNGKDGKDKVIPYLKSLGFTLPIIERFSLGFADGSGSGLYNHLLKSGIKRELVESTTVVNRGKDFLSRRLVAPVYSASGRICAIYGKTSVKRRGESMHVVAEDNVLADIDSMMFGLLQAKQSVVNKKNIFLVDDPFSVILLHTRGVENVVSSPRDNYCEDNLGRLVRFTNSVTLIVPEGGIDNRLVERISILLKLEFRVRIVSISKPVDQFILEEETTNISEYIENRSMDWLSVVLSDNRDRVERTVKLLRSINNEIIRAVYLAEAALVLKMSEALLEKKINV